VKFISYIKPSVHSASRFTFFHSLLSPVFAKPEIRKTQDTKINHPEPTPEASTAMPFPIPSFLKGRSNEKDEQVVAEPSDASARESQPTESTPSRRLIVRVPVAVDEAEQSEPAKLRKLQIRPVPG
jgi:hypothetical protein